MHYSPDDIKIQQLEPRPTRPWRGYDDTGGSAAEEMVVVHFYETVSVCKAKDAQ